LFNFTAAAEQEMRDKEKNTKHVPIEPPLEIWQNSKRPSKMGQSSPSPTLTKYGTIKNDFS
jgi:hypothetical protein